MRFILDRRLPRIALPVLAAMLAGCAVQVDTSPDTFSLETARVSELRGPQALALHNAYNTPALEYAGNQQFGVGNTTWRFDARQMTNTAMVMLQRALANGAITVAPAADKEITLRVRVAGGRIRAIAPWSEVTGYVILDATLGDGSVVSVKADNNSPMGHQRAYDGAILFALNHLLVDRRFVDYVNSAPLSRATLAPSDGPAIASSASGRRYPQAGDSWTYRLTERQRRGSRSRTYAAKVVHSSEGAILDQVSLDGAQPADGAHAKGPYVLDQGVSVLSPYLAVFEELSAGASFAAVASKGESDCRPANLCEASGKVVGAEIVRVPAGNFDAVKVTINLVWQSASGPFPAPPAHRELTAWYAPQVKRLVKLSSRAKLGDVPDFDLELVSYKLQ